MKMISTPSAPAAIGPYSQAVVVGELLFTSGQIPLLPNGELVQGGVEEQTEQVFSNLQAVLVAAGSSLQDVIKVTVFLNDMDDFQAVNNIYSNHFGDHKPARSAVEVARLPRNVAIEIECIAQIKK